MQIHELISVLEDANHCLSMCERKEAAQKLKSMQVAPEPEFHTRNYLHLVASRPETATRYLKALCIEVEQWRSIKKAIADLVV